MADPLAILVVGFFGDLVEDLLEARPRHRVLIIEESDMIESLGFHWHENPRIRIRSGSYQQSLEAAEVGVAWFKSDPFQVVVAGREYGVPAAQLIATRLGLRGPGPTAAQLCTDKLAMREVSASCGLAKGRFAPVSSPADIRSFISDSPVVLKPRSRHASLGVVRINSVDDIESAWSDVFSSHGQGGVTRDRELHWDYMVEDLVSGCGEFSIESLVRAGEVVFSNVTSKKMNSSDHFSPLGHVLPARIPESISEELRRAERRFLESVDMADGIAHSEWIWTDSGPHFVECGVRYPGGGLSRLIASVYGMNLADSLVRLLADGEVPLRACPRGVSAVHYLGGKEGRLVSVQGLSSLDSVDWVADYRVSTPIGSKLSGVRNSADRVGHVAITADSYPSLEARLNWVKDRISVQTE